MNLATRMDRSERFYKIEDLLRERGSVTTAEFLRELEVSPATLKRDLEFMKNRHNAPIEWDRDTGGYRLVQQQAALAWGQVHSSSPSVP